MQCLVVYASNAVKDQYIKTCRLTPRNPKEGAKIRFSQLNNDLLEQVCQVRYKILKKQLLIILYCERLDSLKTKNRKLTTLIAKQEDSYKSSTYSTLLINLSSTELISDEINQFKFGLHYSFVDKNKNIKKP